MARAGSSLGRDSHRYGISNTRTDNSLTNNIHGNSNTNVGNVSNSYNNYNTFNVGVDEESVRIQGWLSPLQPDIRHRAVSRGRMDGVGDWVLQRNEFESWYGSQDSSGDPSLLCYGGQGVGKTFISSLVIDSLHKQTREENMVVLYLYCDYQTQKDQSAVNMIGSLLSQIALEARHTPSDIQRAFQEGQRGRQALRLPDMLKLFIKTVSSIERVYICLDAVDELLPRDRSELLRSLRQIIRDAPNTRLFLTGRPHIRGELDKYLTKGAHIIHIVANQGDIAVYIRRRMEDDEDDGDPEMMPDELKHDILRTMMEKASEMFLLVALNIDAILGETSLAKRKKMLQKVATSGVDLDSVYNLTLQRIREQGGGRSRLGMEVLKWISHAQRPLTINELRHALAAETGTTDINPENICPQDTVLRSCLGLVVVDKWASTVRLIHYTLQEYLCALDVLPTAHRTLARTCLTYLNYDHIKELPVDKAPSLQDAPFLEYSSLYWGIHAKEGISDDVKSLAVELLKHYSFHISATLLLTKMREYSYGSSVRLFPGLHCACYFGIVEVVEALMEMEGCDINQGDWRGYTPLIWAARHGKEGVVSLLLARDDVDHNKPSNEGETPLWMASLKGHEEVVQLLLASDHVDPNKGDRHGQTPLSLASLFRHEGVVRLLLASDKIDVNKPRNDGLTPLASASRSGNEGVVRLLLTSDSVNPDKPDCHGETPLTLACLDKHDKVVRLLLAKGDFNPDQSEKSGQRPLWWACLKGDEGMVRQLLARDSVNADEPDSRGRTPLWWASFCGNEGVVKLLLARDDVNPDKPATGGLTPLSQASMNGHEVVVGLLLGMDNVNPDKPDSVGRTSLWLASQNGHEGVVRQLLTRGDVNPDGLDYWGETPLHQASEGGHEGVAGLLLARGDVNPDKASKWGRTPLWCASARGHEGVVRLLLARDDVDPNRADDKEGTPLLEASSNGHEGVVSLLLARDDINPDKPDHLGRSPVYWASASGHEGVVSLLLARGDVNPDRPDNDGQTPLFVACSNGHAGVVRLLLTRDDINPGRADNQGQTPLQAASVSQYWEIVELLQPPAPAIPGPN